MRSLKSTVALLRNEKQFICFLESCLRIQKQRDGSCLFLTNCKLVPAEVKHLKDSNGNFLTEKMINQQNAVSTNIHDSTNTKNDL